MKRKVCKLIEIYVGHRLPEIFKVYYETSYEKIK